MSATLGYCTNIHAGATLCQMLDELDRHAVAVRRRVNENTSADAATPLPIGLWLSARHVFTLKEGGDPARAAGLSASDPIASLRDWLTERGLEVFTLNGFPYGDFHGPVVKRAVYEPHWGDTRRMLHTMDLAEIAVKLAPIGQSDFSISTLPLGWRATLSAKDAAASMGVAMANLHSLVRFLSELEDRTGICVHVDLEPEPGCMIDRAADVVVFFEALEKQGTNPSPHSMLRRHLGVCHDICHSSVMFESQEFALASYRAAGIQIGKVQISSAIQCDGSERAFRWLQQFVEPKWLHQTCVMDGTGAVHFHDDLDVALDTAPDGLWRSHFHVPIFCDELAPQGAVMSTRSEIEACLGTILPTDRIAAYEVETYAWSALPAHLRKATLAEDVAAELAEARAMLIARGLLPQS
ncbi:MAG: metabolite traffic protein EboE [Planctomycetota bacterium]|nr:metabolite traffic protein EboE [Planctomycetota bacterium]